MNPVKKISTSGSFILKGITMAVLAGLIYSCSPTRYLEEGQVLYTGSDVKIEAREETGDERDLRKALEETVYPEPNARFLGTFRHRLWFYNIAGEVEKKKGFRHWLKNKLGEPPVLLGDVDRDHIRDLMTTRLYNQGYFQPLVSYSTQKKGKKAEVVFTAEIHRPYRIDSVIYPPDTTELLRLVIEGRKDTWLNPGNIYSLEDIRRERERIKSYLLDHGYYRFSPDFLYFQADSTISGHQVRLYLRLKESIPRKNLVKYRVEDIYLYPNYSLDDSLSTSCEDTLYPGNIVYISRKKRFRPEEVLRHIFLEPGKFYDRKAHQKTLSRLIGVNTFRYVNILFEDRGAIDSIGHLDAYIYLTPYKIHSVNAELKGMTKSNNFVGPGLELSYKNLNIFRGTEQLTLSANGSWETQIGGSQEDLNSYEFGFNARLQYPRLETPFSLDYRNSRFVPRTFINLGYSFRHRVRYYSAHSLNAGFGYSWKENPRKQHDLTVLSVEYYQLGRTTEKFDEIVSQNAYLSSSFEDQFILGPRYTWTYNDRVVEELRNNFFFQGRVDLSGILLEEIMKGARAVSGTDFNTQKIFGINYAQYFKIEGDARFYQNLNDNNQLAYRLVCGLGFPVGNSETLPYSKQFYAGGTNDIRAFRARELGPGSYHPPDTADAGIFIEQTGDIKLEANVELRFGIVSFLEGAVFLDAGNVWLMESFEDRPGAQFHLSDFYKEIAVGTGLGLRADFSFLVLRLDLAFPLRKPYLPEGERWVVDEIFGYKGWAGQNLVLNIAIGYPF